MPSEPPHYCERCGSELVEKQLEGRTRYYCSSCNKVSWRNPKPAAGVILLDDERILLVKRGIEPAKGKWSIPAGFLEHDEPPEEAAARELEEETGLKVSSEDLELRETIFIDQEIRGHVLVNVYRVSAGKATGNLRAGDDADDARFWSLKELEDSDEEVRQSYIEPVRNALD